VPPILAPRGSLPGIAFFGDDSTDPGLLDDEIVLVSLAHPHLRLRNGFVPGYDEEPRPLRPNGFVSAERQPEDLPAAGLAALAQKRDRPVEIELAGTLLDPLVRVAEGRFVGGYTLSGAVVHVRFFAVSLDDETRRFSVEEFGHPPK
jgi:hypothetical protein